jgi:MoaA/NifB/PqqE/SkfB family radical SAM enzyme
VASELAYLRSSPKKYLFDGCKLAWHQERLQDFLDGKRIMPIHLDIGIHKACNISCVYCYGVKQVKSTEFIPTDRLLLLAKDAKEVGVKSIAIIGDGEPTMNKGLYEFVQYGKSIGLDMSVATNGLLLNKEQIDILKNNLVWLRFNISGVGEKYDWVMGARKGSFKQFSKVIAEALRGDGAATIGLQMVLIPECFDQVIPLAKQAVEWGVDYLVIKQFSDGGEGMPIHMRMERYEEARKLLQEAEAMSTERTKIIIKWAAMADSISITSNKYWAFDRCIDLPFIFQISGNGRCYPCGYLFGNADYCYGDVTKERLRDILVSEQYWGVINKVKNTPLEKLCTGQCRHCETLKFMDRLTKEYALWHGNLKAALANMCGGVEQYERVMGNPPEHLNFV